MDLQAVLKASGIGAVILIILNLLSLIPCVGCFTFLITLIVYPAIGILAAYFMINPRNGNTGATNGAAAAVIAALIAGVVGTIINFAYFSFTGSDQMAQAVADLPPDQLAALAELGVDPTLMAGGLGMLGILGFSVICCGLWAIFAALLGAAGGAFWGSTHQD
jgi:hypothetical protein